MIKNKTIHYIFIFGLVSNLIIPRMNLQGINIYPIYPISILMFVIWAYIALDKQLSVKINKSIYYLLLILISMSASFSIPLIIHHTEFTVQYFIYEVMVYLIMLPFFLMMNHLDIDEQTINKTITLCFLIFASVGVLQWLGVSTAVTLYAFDKHVEIALAGLRLTLTGSDPNIGSIIASFFVLYFFTYLLYSRSPIKLLYLVIATALLFKTQGRTTMIGVALIMIFSLLVLIRIKLFYRILIMIFGAILIFYFAKQFDLFYLIEGINTLEQGSNNSINTRLDNAKYAYLNFKESPIIGWGSSLEQFGLVRHLDSEMFLILQRYGLFGALVILYIICNILYTGFKFRHTKLGLFLLMMMGSLMFNMLTNVVFFGAQTSSIILFLIYIRYYLNRYEKNNISSSIAT